MNTRKLIEWSASICGAAVCISAVLFLSTIFHWRAYDGRSFPVPVRIQELVFLAVAACIPTAWVLFRRPSKETPDQSGLSRLTDWAVIFLVGAVVLFNVLRLIP